MFQIIIKDLDTGEIKADKKIKCFIAGGCDENGNGVIVNAIAGTPAECVSALCAAEAAKKENNRKTGSSGSISIRRTKRRFGRFA